VAHFKVGWTSDGDNVGFGWPSSIICIKVKEQMD